MHRIINLLFILYYNKLLLIIIIKNYKPQKISMHTSFTALQIFERYSIVCLVSSSMFGVPVVKHFVTLSPMMWISDFTCVNEIFFLCEFPQRKSSGESFELCGGHGLAPPLSFHRLWIRCSGHFAPYDTRVAQHHCVGNFHILVKCHQSFER